MQLFGGKLAQSPDAPPFSRHHFDYFGPSMITVFILLTGTWYVPMMEVVECTSTVSALYFIAIVIIGTYLIMNLFLVVLLQLFTLEINADDPPTARTPTGSELKVTIADAARVLTEGRSSVTPQVVQREMMLKRRQELVKKAGAVLVGRVLAKTVEKKMDMPWPHDYSLFVFGPRNGFRRWCGALVGNPRFESAVLFLIIVSSVALALDEPRLPDDSPLARVLQRLDRVFTVAFCFECFAKVVTSGFASGPAAYTKSRCTTCALRVVSQPYALAHYKNSQGSASR